MKPLGRLTPTNWSHVEKYPLRTLATPPKGVPVAIGVNWYVEFDNPVKDDAGRYWVAKDGNLTTIRGGHCVCLKPSTIPDPLAWMNFYNQGQEGACVGFGESRMMSLLNRKRYNARWLWQRARLTDEWPDNDDLSDPNQGTSVNAGLAILMNEGHERYNADAPNLADGISAFRWATTVDEILVTLDSPIAYKLEAVPFLNSWGADYPHITWMPATVLQRLLSEDGEAGIVTDR
jgi:hypothetical protein